MLLLNDEHTLPLCIGEELVAKQVDAWLGHTDLPPGPRVLSTDLHGVEDILELYAGIIVFQLQLLRWSCISTNGCLPFIEVKQ